mmetsp:Transcript_12851/g.35238  ORF Transcript_12851/g.35238 Transcript_12851/m.35238 type:complete len:392 (-) Transcript_12851:32-1207(-)
MAPADTQLSFFEALYAAREADAHEIAPGISLGAASAAKDKQAMRKRRISHVLIVHPALKEEHPQKFVYGRIPLLDDPCANLLETLPDALAFCLEARAAKGHVFVHCAKGISRSSSVVIAMLMFERGISFDEAFKLCEQRRPIVYPNIGFQQQLRHLDGLLQDIDRSATPQARLKQLKAAVPRGKLDGPGAALPVRERMSDSVSSVLDELQALSEKVCSQPQLLQKRELWKRHGLYFENLHKYKGLPSDVGLLDRAQEASKTLKSLPAIFSDTLKGVQLALAVAKDFLSAKASGGKVSKKDKKAKKAEKKAVKAAKKARKLAEKIDKAARKAEEAAGRSRDEAQVAAERAEAASRELERLEAEERLQQGGDSDEESSSEGSGSPAAKRRRRG